MGCASGFGDHAQYLAHAKAIVEGRPYTDIGYIYHPAAPMLAPRAYAAGTPPHARADRRAGCWVDSPLNQLLMLVSVFGLCVARVSTASVRPRAVAGCACCGFTAVALEARMGTIVPLSDPGFCALLWGIIFVVDAPVWTWQRIALVTR